MSCEKHKYYFTPTIEGSVYESESKKPIDSVKISISLKHKFNLKLLSKKNTLSNKKGKFSLSSDYIFYKGDGREEESLFAGKYIRFLLFEKKGYKSDTIQFNDLWESKIDTLIHVSPVYLSLLKKE